MKLSPANEHSSQPERQRVRPILTRTESGWIVEYAVVTLDGRREVILRPLDTRCRRTAAQRSTALLTALGLPPASAQAR